MHSDSPSGPCQAISFEALHIKRPSARQVEKRTDTIGFPTPPRGLPESRFDAPIIAYRPRLSRILIELIGFPAALECLHLTAV